MSKAIFQYSDTNCESHSFEQRIGISNVNNSNTIEYITGCQSEAKLKKEHLNFRSPNIQPRIKYNKAPIERNIQTEWIYGSFDFSIPAKNNPYKEKKNTNRLSEDVLRVLHFSFVSAKISSFEVDIFFDRTSRSLLTFSICEEVFFSPICLGIKWLTVSSSPSVSMHGAK
ncbi:hypothetical protein [uncultured Duncaniella sp.]|uniref:hypothetical protein n=1 Tax=uncultured Duncaniella sp. TaxID=2768039 RepID=UPI00262F5CCD|nr:hypothetical protein [uncultured Duncaniella sp.]